MKIRKIVGLSLFSIMLSTQAMADEGMWLLTMLGDKYKDMKAHGLKLKAKDIYDINNSSLKDAICTMNHGSCTAEVISKDALVLTNHHCGYGAIQQFSSEENDYLTDGFWAMKREDELYVPDMTYTFLIRVEQVTAKVLEGVTPEMSEAQRAQIIEKNAEAIKAEAIKDTHYEAEIKPFYDGNDYYLFVNETFTDVRLVGAPPSSIGKYGGDTDNWMWPRHTGDFSMFRIYAGKDGKPAEYSKDNVPMQAKHHLPINIAGVQPGDFAMILGYPGSTDRFLTSYGVQLAIEKDQPARIKIRAKKLELMKQDMDKSDKVRIQYASKYAQVSNYWKYFIGQSSQLVNNNVYDKKKALEDKFEAWVNKDESRKKVYGNVIKDIADAYKAKESYWFISTYLGEAVIGSDLNKFMYRNLLANLGTLGSEDEATLKATRESIKESAEAYFKDYNASTDKNIYAAMMAIYTEDIPSDMHPEELTSINEEYKGDMKAFAEDVFASSIFTDEKRFNENIDKLTMDMLKDDKAFQLMLGFMKQYAGKVQPMSAANEAKLERATRLFVDGLRKMEPGKIYSPNANSTLRLTYGNVGGYQARDAVYYTHYTTLDGLMAKEDPTNPEFIVPEKLSELHKSKDYGRYAEDGELHTCFISNNDITGGNSGSPVINARGELIGCAFDGNWEAMSGDIFFEDELQRTISVDIRYVLFIIEKYAGAKHLIDEMTIVNKPTKPMKMKKKA